jgi:hypothetical protein
MLHVELPGIKQTHDVKIVSRPALQREILDMTQRDQDVRNKLLSQLAKNSNLSNLADDDPMLTSFMAVDAENLRRLKHIIDQDGFPTVSMVGLSGVHALFLLTQHADSDHVFQAQMLKVFAKRVRQGEVESADFAYLTDRVLVAQSKPQLYGTQFVLLDGKWQPKRILDEAHVDRRRRSVGLGSMADYTCILRASNPLGP